MVIRPAAQGSEVGKLGVCRGGRLKADYARGGSIESTVYEPYGCLDAAAAGCDGRVMRLGVRGIVSLMTRIVAMIRMNKCIYGYRGIPLLNFSLN